MPKQGNDRHGCEDAWNAHRSQGRLALSDGASDAFESRYWAQALVRAFVSKPPNTDTESFLEWLKSPIHLWHEKIRWDELTWYQAEKARRGAFATILGVTLDPPVPNSAEEDKPSVEWHALGVGDTCLFHIQEDKVVASFPVERVEDFGLTPALLSTRQEYNRRSLQELRICTGTCRPGDWLILTTDALAAWLLGQAERGKLPWRRFRDLTTEKLARLLTNLRQKDALRNDDVTLVLAWIEDTNACSSVDHLITPQLRY